MSIANLVYVGTYSEPAGGGRGIHSFRFDPATGRMSPHGVAEMRNPSFFCFDAGRQYLYAVNELKQFEGDSGGGLSGFRIDQETGALTFLNAKPSRGTNPCHVSVDPGGKFVFAANYTSGSVIGYRIEADGSLGEEVAFVQHVGSSADPDRQAGPHAHAVEFDAAGRYLYVADLGLDKVMIYEVDAATGRLTPARQPSMATAPGAGPRHLAMHPGGGHAYLINELDSTITACRRDAATGGLTELQTLSTLPDGARDGNSCAEVQLGPDGRFLYGSNRGHDSIVIYAVEPASGRLTLVGHESTGGRVPRSFEISPDGRFLIVANQDTNNLMIFRIDQGTGKLTNIGESVEAPTPVCVRFV